MASHCFLVVTAPVRAHVTMTLSLSAMGEAWRRAELLVKPKFRVRTISRLRLFDSSTLRLFDFLVIPDRRIRTDDAGHDEPESREHANAAHPAPTTARVATG